MRAAFSAVVDAVSSVTSSSGGPRQSLRICSASDGPPSGAQPVKTTMRASTRRAKRSASATSRRQARLMRYEPSRAEQAVAEHDEGEGAHGSRLRSHHAGAAGRCPTFHVAAAMSPTTSVGMTVRKR